MIEKIADCNDKPDGPGQEDQGGEEEDDASPPGLYTSLRRVGQNALADRHPAAGAQEGVVLAYAVGDAGGKSVACEIATGSRAGRGGRAEKCFVALVVIDERSPTACLYFSFRHGRAGRESRRLDYSVRPPVDRQGKSGGNQERQGLEEQGLGISN